MQGDKTRRQPIGSRLRDDRNDVANDGARRSREADPAASPLESGTRLAVEGTPYGVLLLTNPIKTPTDFYVIFDPGGGRNPDCSRCAVLRRQTKHHFPEFDQPRRGPYREVEQLVQQQFIPTRLF